MLVCQGGEKERARRSWRRDGRRECVRIDSRVGRVVINGSGSSSGRSGWLGVEEEEKSLRRRKRSNRFLSSFALSSEHTQKKRKRRCYDVLVLKKGIWIFFKTIVKSEPFLHPEKAEWRMTSECIHTRSKVETERTIV